VVYDHLHRHQAAPDAGQAFDVVGPLVQPAMPPLPIGLQVRGLALPGRRSLYRHARASQDLEAAGLVKLNRLQALVLNVSGLPADLIPGLESVPGLGRFAYAQGEIPFFLTQAAPDQKCIPQIIMAALVKGAQQPDAGLDRYQLALKRDLCAGIVALFGHGLAPFG